MAASQRMGPRRFLPALRSNSLSPVCPRREAVCVGGFSCWGCPGGCGGAVASRGILWSRAQRTPRPFSCTGHREEPTAAVTWPQSRASHLISLQTHSSLPHSQKYLRSSEFQTELARRWKDNKLFSRRSLDEGHP